jgi:hypothetical protein
MIDDWFNQIGVHVADVFAGFCGGLVNALVLKTSQPWAIVASVIVGGITANYMSQPIAHYIGTSQGTSAFMVGLGGMAICQGLMKAAESWRPFNVKGSSDADKPRP